METLIRVILAPTAAILQEMIVEMLAILGVAMGMPAILGI
jgi:hypothetical protein